MMVHFSSVISFCRPSEVGAASMGEKYYCSTLHLHTVLTFACQSKHWKIRLKEQSTIVLHTWDKIFLIFKSK